MLVHLILFRHPMCQKSVGTATWQSPSNVFFPLHRLAIRYIRHLANTLSCPVDAIYPDYDPPPYNVTSVPPNLRLQQRLYAPQSVSAHSSALALYSSGPSLDGLDYPYMPQTLSNSMSHDYLRESFWQTDTPLPDYQY